MERPDAFSAEIAHRTEEIAGPPDQAAQERRRKRDGDVETPHEEVPSEERTSDGDDDVEQEGRASDHAHPGEFPPGLGEIHFPRGEAQDEKSHGEKAQGQEASSPDRPVGGHQFTPGAEEAGWWRETASVTQWPPNPKEFTSARSRLRARARWGT